MERVDERLETLGRARTHIKPECEEPLRTPSNPRRAPCQYPNFEPNPRRPIPELVDQDTRLEVPTFDGCLDPKIYIDWEGDMDQYFKGSGMTE